MESPETNENEPKPIIILLDGSKGAGKTTAGEILAQRLKGAVFLALDTERRALVDNHSSRPISERNKEAFEKVMNRSEQNLDNGHTLVIDCGLLEERVVRIEALATMKNAHLYKFLLKAPYETELNRVRSRDAAKGNDTNEARFAEVHGLVHAKNFDDFITIDTDQITANEVADKVMKSIGR